jgi:hypothetical protein
MVNLLLVVDLIARDWIGLQKFRLREDLGKLFSSSQVWSETMKSYQVIELLLGILCN